LGASLVGSLVARDAVAQQSTPALAPGNGDGLDTHLFRPAIDSKGFFTTNGSEVLGHTDLSFGLVIDYGHTLLRVVDQGQKSPQLINHSFQGTAQFNFGLFNRLVLGLDLPVNLMAGDEQVNKLSPPSALFPGLWGTTALDSQTPSFIALHAKYRITRIDSGIGLAVAVQLGVPLSGDAAKNAGTDPSVWYWPQLIVEKRIGSRDQFRIALNVGYRGHNASTTQLFLNDGTTQAPPAGTNPTPNWHDGSRVTYGGAVSYRVLEPLDLVAETYATYHLGDAASALKMSNEVVGGIKLFVERNSYLMVGAGPRYTNGFEAADIRGFVGFIFEPSIGDRDGDGIKDDLDQCPDEPEDKDGFKDEDGCPDPDNDNDGILDKDDRCINVPEDRDGDTDWDGCPESRDGDRDGDGILDSKDKCPDDPEDRDGFEDADGCPDPDNDKDGIPDKLDKCPNDPEDKDGFEDDDGCPDPDNDKDGIPDIRDKCPNEPENFNGFEDEDGCPDKGNVIIQDNSLIILEKIKFATGSAAILPQSNKILDEVAQTLNHHPEFLLVELAGHADERSDDSFNLRLTQDRVNSVMRALISRGVDKSRLRAKGYGEYCPIDTAHNEAAWEQNRRVEFKIVKTKDGPTGVELGCQNATAHGVKPEPVP
jgi:outer membrane protein OmpA-like peptidoglycan-associated protein